MATLRFRPHKTQRQALRSKARIIMYLAGIGTGKTTLGSFWTIIKCKHMVEGQVGLIAANSYSQLCDSTLRNFYKVCNEAGIKLIPEQVPKGSKPFAIRMWNGKFWSEILCRSLDNYESLAGVELSWAWSDETYQTKPEALDLVNERLRDESNGEPVQTLVTTSVDDPASSLYKMAVEDYKEGELDATGYRLLKEVIYATTYDNEHNLPNGYIENLKRTLSGPRFERQVESKWVFSDGNRIYHSFDKKIQVTKDAEFNERLPICWSCDQNISAGSPMSSCVGHIIYSQLHQPIIHIFDELILESSDTNDSIAEFTSRYCLESHHKNDVIVYGDQTGTRKDSRSKTSDYKLMYDAGYRNQRLPSKNPPVRSRHNSVNSMLLNAFGEVRLLIHPRCKVLIKGLELGRLRKGAQYLEVEDYEQHVCTALGYFVNYEFPIDNRLSQIRKLHL